MEEIWLKWLKRVIGPFMAYLFVDKCYPAIQPYVGNWISSVAPSMGELAKMVAVIGIGSIFAEEIVQRVMIPPARDVVVNTIVPAISQDLGKIREALAASLREKGLIVRTQIEREPQDAELPEEPDLKKAKQLLVEGHLTSAISLLSALAERKPEYRVNLLSVLLSSPGVNDWKRGQELLTVAGKVTHYIRLGYNYWSKSDFVSAIAVTEAAYARFVEGEPKASQPEIDKIENSLAYFYADAKLAEKQDFALQLSEAVVKRRSELHDANLGSALATRGYVRITFGKGVEDIRQGISDCEDARRKGARDDLYFRHLARAQERLLSMGAA